MKYTKNIACRSAADDVFQLVKKVRSDFFDKLRQNRKIKNNYKSTTMGVCPVWGRRRVSTSEVFSFSVLVQMQGWQDI